MMRLASSTIRMMVLLLISPSFGQGDLVQQSLDFLKEQTAFEMDKLHRRDAHSPCHMLLVDCWASSASGKTRQPGQFGLRFQPVNDQNIYLLYQYELKKVKAKAEIGFSVNHFNAVSLKYAQAFTFTGFK